MKPNGTDSLISGKRQGMKRGIALFIYDRPQCTKKVLESLKQNHIQELYIFQDGLGEKTNQKGWEENKNIIDAIDWCNVHFEQNICKANSLDEQIVHGINRVFEQNDEIIVIEDDCVISKDCIAFMEQCFDRYKDNKKVLDISAYLEPIHIPEYYKLPILATGIPAGWGWGTWKDRWEEFQKEYAIVKRVGNARKHYDGFHSFGYVIQKILSEYWLLGTWDFWWSVYVLEKRGISIRPVRNKLHNIGFENPGTHTSGKSPWVIPIEDKIVQLEIFPEEIEIESWVKLEFEKFYKKIRGNKSIEERQTYYRNCLEKWIELKQCDKSIAVKLSQKGVNKIAIYGMGTIGELLIKEIDEQIEITGILVTDKTVDRFMGYPVYGQKEIYPGDFRESTLIIIPGYDMKEIEQEIRGKFLKIYSLDELLT